MRSGECGLRTAECGQRTSAERGRSAECGVRPQSADIGRPMSAERGVLRSAEYGDMLYLQRSSVLCCMPVRQARVGVALVSEPAETECGASHRRSAECGAQQGLKLTKLEEVGGLVAAHAYSRTFPRYPNPTMHGQPLRPSIEYPLCSARLYLFYIFHAFRWFPYEITQC